MSSSILKDAVIPEGSEGILGWLVVHVCCSVKILLISLIDFDLCARQTVKYMYLLEMLNSLLYNIY